jgi:release factor glutamine methyltransferase
MTISEALRYLARELEKSGSGTPRLDAEVMAAHALGMQRQGLIIDGARALEDGEQALLEGALRRRADGEPVAYITGEKEFYSLTFRVDGRVLVPRPETELLVDLVVYHAPRGGRVLDLGTGSGAVAVAVKHNRPDCRVYASDISPRALELARENARDILGEDAVLFLEGDLFEPCGDERFDIIVSNPPYIDPAIKPSLPPELAFEPEKALFCGDGGMEVIGRIIGEGPRFLAAGGIIVFEIGAGMEGDVLTRAGNAGYDAHIVRDYAGLPRVALLKT